MIEDNNQGHAAEEVALTRIACSATPRQEAESSFCGLPSACMFQQRGIVVFNV